MAIGIAMLAKSRFERRVGDSGQWQRIANQSASANSAMMPRDAVRSFLIAFVRSIMQVSPRTLMWHASIRSSAPAAYVVSLKSIIDGAVRKPRVRMPS